MQLALRNPVPVFSSDAAQVVADVHPRRHAWTMNRGLLKQPTLPQARFPPLSRVRSSLLPERRGRNPVKEREATFPRVSGWQSSLPVHMHTAPHCSRSKRLRLEHRSVRIFFFRLWGERKNSGERGGWRGRQSHPPHSVVARSFVLAPVLMRLMARLVWFLRQFTRFYDPDKLVDDVRNRKDHRETSP